MTTTEPVTAVMKKQGVIQVRKEKEEEKQGSDGNDAYSAADEDMRHKMKSKEMDREGMIDYVKNMKTNGVNISEGKMSGIEIKAALDLAVTPSLTSKDKNYLSQSSHGK